MSSQICMSDIKRNIQQKLFWFCKLGCIFFSLEYQFVVNSKQSRSLWKKILSLHNVVKYVRFQEEYSTKTRFSNLQISTLSTLDIFSL